MIVVERVRNESFLNIFVPVAYEILLHSPRDNYLWRKRCGWVWDDGKFEGPQHELKANSDHKEQKETLLNSNSEAFISSGTRLD